MLKHAGNRNKVEDRTESTAKHDELVSELALNADEDYKRLQRLE